MKSYILLIAALGTLGQATWPPTLSASKPTTQDYFDYKPPLETVTIPNFPSAQTSSSSQDPDEEHSLSSLPTGPSVSTGPPSALASLSSLPTANTSSSRQDTVQHTISSAPMMHFSSSPISTVACSQAYNSSSQPTSVITPLSGASSSRSSSSHVDDNLKTHTVTEYDTRTITATVTTIVTAAVIDHEAPCTKPVPAVCEPRRKPTRPHPITPVDASMKPGPTWCYPLHRVHGTVRPHASDDKKNQASPTPGGTLRKPHGTIGPYSSGSENKHQPVPTSRGSIHESHGTVRPYPPDDDKHQAGPKQSGPIQEPHATVGQYPTESTKKYPQVITELSEATCPLDFTCQPDDDYTENEQYPRKSPHVCPEGYSCQMRKKLLPPPPRLSPPVLESPPYSMPSLIDPPPHQASPSTSARPPAAVSPSAGAVLSVPATAMYVMIAPIIGLFMA